MTTSFRKERTEQYHEGSIDPTFRHYFFYPIPPQRGFSFRSRLLKSALLQRTVKFQPMGYFHGFALLEILKVKLSLRVFLRYTTHLRSRMVTSFPVPPPLWNGVVYLSHTHLRYFSYPTTSFNFMSHPATRCTHLAYLWPFITLKVVQILTLQWLVGNIFFNFDLHLFPLQPQFINSLAGVHAIVTKLEILYV